MKKTLSIFILLILALPSQVKTQCSEFTFDDLEYASVAKIKGRAGTRAYFHREDSACMSNGSCRMPQFIVPNDYILVGSPTDYSACSLYVNGRTGVYTRGWIKGQQISYNSTPTLSSWAGTWRSDDGGTIVLTVRNGRVSARGNTSLGNRTGEFSGSAAVSDGILTLSSEDCKVRLAHLGARIYVADNGMCGGINVSFNGSYKKRP